MEERNKFTHVVLLEPSSTILTNVEVRGQTDCHPGLQKKSAQVRLQGAWNTTHVDVSVGSASEISYIPSKDGSVDIAEPVPAELLPQEPRADWENETNDNAQWSEILSSKSFISSRGKQLTQ